MTDAELQLALTIECPQCGAAIGAACRTSLGYKSKGHWRRLWEAQDG